MREIRTSGSTRGEWAALLALPSLLYRLSFVPVALDLAAGQGLRAHSAIKLIWPIPPVTSARMVTLECP